MAVPAHDTRDFAFAKKYGIPIRTVIAPPGYAGGDLPEAYVEPGTMVNSGQFDGMPSEQAIKAITDFAQTKSCGKHTVSYHLRDWLISHQRYWGRHSYGLL
jgi:leucyl-tRNA synthetase